ncbi:MAG: prepilin-type N-terminal cleavage/methylation domain-containing protein [Lentisphaeria bacterium]
MRLIKYKNKRFTLVEVMVSLAILVIMMGFLFEFVIGAQKVWSANRRMAKLFSNAQIVFKWLEQDINNAVYQSGDDYPGKEIPFLCYPSTDTYPKYLFMVVAESPSALPNQYFTSLLYVIQDDTSITKLTGDKLKKLYREEWPGFSYMGKDFAGVSSHSVAATDDEVLIDGIVKAKITLASEASATFPSALKIEVTLCDYDKIVQLNNDDAQSTIIRQAIIDTSRTFSKIIFLNRY